MINRTVKFCYMCAAPISLNEEGVPICVEHGPLWPLHRNAVCGDALIVNDKNQILLARRDTEPHKGQWGMPGGFTNYGEHPEGAAVREVLEETGWEVESIELVGVYLETVPGDRSSEHRVSATYRMKPVRQRNTEGVDTPDMQWFDLDDLPQVPPAHLERIKDL